MPAKREQLIGRVFGRLTVTAEPPGKRAVCTCECGTVRSIARKALTRAGGTQSCGCLAREVASETAIAFKPRLSHGMVKAPEYSIWRGMLRRCSKPKDSSFPNYGGRGI